MGPATIASSSPRSASVTASSNAAAAARALSAVGFPGREPGYLPMTLLSTVRAMLLEFRARSTISGPIPAQSPSVIPMRGVLLVLMLVIVIESYIIDYEHDYEHAMSAPRFFR